MALSGAVGLTVTGMYSSRVKGLAGKDLIGFNLELGERFWEMASVVLQGFSDEPLFEYVYGGSPQAQSIVFIYELDAVGKERGLINGSGGKEHDATLNQVNLTWYMLLQGVIVYDYELNMRW
ncbi:hypothetical protein Tco_0813978, partial [Tanacetum coccineum]